MVLPFSLMDDYSHMILAWELCSSMTAANVTETLDRAIEYTGVYDAKVAQQPRLLSDNGPCYVSKNLKEYLKAHRMDHTRGRSFYSMTQDKKRTLSLVDEKHHSPEQLLSAYGTESSNCTVG